MRYKLTYDPKTRTFTRVDPQKKRLRDYKSHEIVPDIGGYWSVASNRWIEGRAQRREDLKATGCREVDPSEKSEFMRGPSDDLPPWTSEDTHHLYELARKRGLY